MTTREDALNIINSKEYDFLKTNIHLGENIILLGLGGSRAYNLEKPDSDWDIRGVALNSKDDVLTWDDFEQIVDNQTDTTIYSINRIVKLLSDCNPNTIEILGLEPEHYLYLHPIGKELIENSNMFLSKKAIKTFGGFSSQMLYRLQQKEKSAMDKSNLEKHILKTLQSMRNDFKDNYTKIDSDALHLYIDNSEQDNMDTEIFMDVVLTHYPLRDYCKLWNQLQQTVSSYNQIGKRNKYAITHGRMCKHMAHLVRLYYMVFDILENQKIITCRKDYDEHNLLIAIRNGKFITEDNSVLPEFYDLLSDLEKRFEYDKSNTSLPERPNYKEINEFVASVNERIVLGKL